MGKEQLNFNGGKIRSLDTFPNIFRGDSANLNIPPKEQVESWILGQISKEFSDVGSNRELVSRILSEKQEVIPEEFKSYSIFHGFAKFDKSDIRRWEQYFRYHSTRALLPSIEPLNLTDSQIDQIGNSIDFAQKAYLLRKNRDTGEEYSLHPLRGALLMVDALNRMDLLDSGSMDGDFFVDLMVTMMNHDMYEDLDPSSGFRILGKAVVDDQGNRQFKANRLECQNYKPVAKLYINQTQHEATVALTRKKTGDNDRFTKVSKNPIATIVKPMERTDNLLTMHGATNMKFVREMMETMMGFWYLGKKANAALEVSGRKHGMRMDKYAGGNLMFMYPFYLAYAFYDLGLDSIRSKVAHELNGQYENSHKVAMPPVSKLMEYSRGDFYSGLNRYVTEIESIKTQRDWKSQNFFSRVFR